MLTHVFKNKLYPHCLDHGLTLSVDDNNRLFVDATARVRHGAKGGLYGGILLATRQRGGHLIIELWDTGIGIAAVDQATIFDEVVRLSNPRRDRSEGLGLGLAIVAQLSGYWALKLAAVRAWAMVQCLQLRYQIMQPQRQLEQLCNTIEASALLALRPMNY